MGNFLTKDQIFAVQLRTDEVPIPEWGGSIRIREMTAKEMQENGRFVIRPDGKVDYSKAVQVPVQMCLKMVVDEAGQRLFTDGDIPRLEQMHASAVTKIANAVRKLSGMVDEDDLSGLKAWLEENHPRILEEYRESLNPVAMAEENFTQTRNGGSPSA